MNTNNDDFESDELIDSLYKESADDQPPASLDNRILAHAKGQARRRTSTWVVPAAVAITPVFALGLVLKMGYFGTGGAGTDASTDVYGSNEVVLRLPESDAKPEYERIERPSREDFGLADEQSPPTSRERYVQPQEQYEVASDSIDDSAANVLAETHAAKSVAAAPAPLPSAADHVEAAEVPRKSSPAIAARSAEDSTPDGEWVACPQERPQICTKEYDPVCAQVDTGVRCIRAPCPDASEERTFSNACTACADPEVFAWRAGASGEDTGTTSQK